MQRVVLFVVVVSAVSWAHDPCFADEPGDNQWGPFTGTVVDARTNEPIPGAVFVVFWQQLHVLPGPRTFFDARVAVADETGRFTIPPRDKASFFTLVNEPNLECVAPGYAPYQRVGAKNAPIEVKLRPLTIAEQRNAGSSDGMLVLIPRPDRHAFEDSINQKRAQMHLTPIGFGSGNLEQYYPDGVNKVLP